VSLTCTAPCGAVVDGGAVGIDEARQHVFYLEPGQHTVAADFGATGSQEQVVAAEPGKAITVALAAPERPAATAFEQSSARRDVARPRGLRPRWFVASASITGVTAGVWAWSGIDVLRHNSKYKADPTARKLSDGQNRERRTNILLVGTLAGAVATSIIALNTRWWSTGPAEPAASVGVAPVDGGALVVFEGAAW
jgi:hypothetical protein